MLFYNLKLLFLHLAKYLGFFFISRKITKNGLRILCYHNFSTGDEVNWRPKLFIRPELFQKRMEYLKKNKFSILTFEEAFDRLKNDVPENASIVITIDDGWYGTKKYAHPILKKMQFPYTVYVTSYYSTLDNPVFNLIIPFLFHISLKQNADFTPLDIRGVGVVDLSNNMAKDEIVYGLLKYGDNGNAETRRQLTSKIADILEIDLSNILTKKTFHIMKPGELRKLDSQGVNLQLHTHRHHWPKEKASAFEELRLNRHFINGIRSEKSVNDHFCYPSGLFKEEQFLYLKETNIKSAVTCVPGLNYKSTHNYALKRFLDGENISQIEFEAEMNGFLEILRIARGR